MNFTKPTLIDIITLILVTTIALIFIYLIDIYPNKSYLLLSFEVLIIPLIYQIGNLIHRDIKEKEFNSTLNDLNEYIDDMEYSLNELEQKNKYLKSELRKLNK